MKKKEVVIAGYNRDLDWVKKLNEEIIVTIYRKGELKTYENEIFLSPNVGRDVHTFFYHISTRYETLSDITFFVQDYPFDHWENLIEVVNADENYILKKSTLNFGEYYGFHFNSIGTMWDLYPSEQFGNGGIISCLSNGYPQDTINNINVDEYWGLLFDCPKPIDYEFIPGGHFGVGKNQIHVRPKYFYDKIVELLSVDEFAPWRIERLEGYIFNPKFKIK